MFNNPSYLSRNELENLYRMCVCEIVIANFVSSSRRRWLWGAGEVQSGNVRRTLGRRGQPGSEDEFAVNSDLAAVLAAERKRWN